MGDFVRQWIEQSGYLGVAFLMFLETVFPPIPSEVIMSLSGLQAQRGTMTLWGAIAAGTSGAMAGNILWYIFARWLGVDRLRPIVDRFGRWLTVDWHEVERADHFFDRSDRLWLVLRVARLDRDDIARIGLALCDADPRRDVDGFADRLDAIAGIAPEAAAEALATARLHHDFRRAVIALAQGKRT